MRDASRSRSSDFQKSSPWMRPVASSPPSIRRGRSASRTPSDTPGGRAPATRPRRLLDDWHAAVVQRHGGIDPRARWRPEHRGNPQPARRRRIGNRRRDAGTAAAASGQHFAATFAASHLRNTIHFGSQYLWAMSLLLLPLATVFALEFTMPAWTIVLAPFFLGERMTTSRIGAVVLGLAGVLVILRPGLEAFQPAALLVLAAALGYAIQIIVTKKLTSSESP